MNKIFTIAKWELLEKMKSKAFIISLILTPVLMIGFSILPQLFIDNESEETKTIGVLDFTGEYEQGMINKLDTLKIESGLKRFNMLPLRNSSLSQQANKDSANQYVVNKKMVGYLLIEQGKKDLTFEFRSESVGSFKELGMFEREFNSIRRHKLISDYNLSDTVAAKLGTDIDVTPVKVDKKGTTEEIDFSSQFNSSMIFVMLQFSLILMTGGMLIRSLVEEKSNRLIEIIVSSCTANELLFGKIIGLSLLVLAQLAVWGLIGFSLAGHLAFMMMSFSSLALMMVFFLLGFFMYTAIFVGIGSMVNTEQEAQQITGYLSMLLILPIIFLVPLVQDPNQSLAKILSYIPLTAPAIMITRINLTDVPVIEILLSMTSIIAFTVAIVFLSARIFRIGILSYGKVPSLKELATWVKQSN